MAQVVVMLADGFEEIEGLTVVDLLRRADIEVDMVSITGNLLVTGSHNIRVTGDALFEDFNFDNTDMIVLPGGMPGTKHLGAYEPLISLLKQFYGNDRYIAAICAAPSILGENGMLEGKEAVAYPTFLNQLKGAKVSDKKVVRDGKIVTSKGMGTSIDFALELIRVIKGNDIADKIKESIQYS